MNTYTDYLGIDISKESFDVVNREGKHFQYINSPKGFAEFKKEIPKDSLSTMEYKWLSENIENGKPSS